MTLRSRLTAVVAAVVIAAVASAAWVSYVVVAGQLGSEVDHFLLDRARQVSEGTSPHGSGRGPPPDREVPPQDQPYTQFDTAVQVLSASGAVEIHTGVNVDLPVSAADRAVCAAGKGPVFHTVALKGASYRVVTVPVASGGAIQIGRDITANNRVLSSLRWRFGLIAAAGTVVAALAAWWIARRTTSPIVALTAAAEHVAATQDLSTPIEPNAGGEVGRLASSFNTMLSALEMSRRQQRQLVQDASHELRTPLTALRTNVELLARGDRLADTDRTALVGDLDAEVGELTALVAELVDLATDQTRSETPVPVELGDVGRELAERARRRSARTVDVVVSSDAVVSVRRSQLERAVGNLIDNAVKFSPADVPVEVSVTGAVIAVRDHGPGIAQADLEHIFDRFYRAASSRSLPGSGLGLAIVRQFAQDHDGRVWAANAPGGGAIVTLDLTSCVTVDGD